MLGTVVVLMLAGAGATLRGGGDPTALAAGGGFMAIIVLLIYPMLGFASGVITAVVFNFAAKITGGLQIDISGR